MSYGFVGEDKARKEHNRWHIQLICRGYATRPPTPQPEDMRQINLELL